MTGSLSGCGGSDSQQGLAGADAPTTVKEVQRAEATPTREVPAPIADGSGSILTYSTVGYIDYGNPFFAPLGNGRACASCHQEGQAWSVTPAALQARFNASAGSDPIFQTVDGSNSPDAVTATLAQKQSAYSMLLTKGVIRVGLPLPAGAEFELTQVNDPYGFASAAQLSLFRRPLPAANLSFESTVMWDGRETLAASSNLCIKGTAPSQCFATQNADLGAQANAAAEGHAQLVGGLNATQQQSIVDFESALFVAQVSDNAAGNLGVNGATGGTQNLAAVPFYFGINDVVSGDYRSGTRFSSNVMNLFTAWQTAAPAPLPPGGRGAPPPVTADPAANARASIARGEQLFNTRPFDITGVAGLNDVLNQPNVRGTCSTCHDSPNAGTMSAPRLLDTGVAAANLRTPDLPLYTLKNIATGAMRQTTDPGRALITGKWSDLDKFKVPNLRGLAARAPYFHNGSQADLPSVIRFYDHRFQIGLSPQDVTDLANFLRAL
ncbi:MAG: cytochrome C [Burkholderiaceae bacterium]|nr:cytochrome C [Burkholderiaceae bacterium]